MFVNDAIYRIRGVNEIGEWASNCRIRMLPMSPPFRFLYASILLATSPVIAALPEAITSKERSQGYREHVILAKPRAEFKTLVDEEERRGELPVRKKFSRFGDLRVLETKVGESAPDAVQRLKATGLYEFVELDQVKTRDELPNDPRFTNGDQWHLRNTGQAGGTTGADLAASAAWSIRTDASSVLVAVVDTGIRLTHEDLAANLWTNPGEIPGNGIDDDGNGYIDDVHGINSLATRGSPASGNPDDDYGHGTSVAGVIGAVGNNGKGISGIAWRVKLMALKFDDAEGSATTSNEIECIDYALAKGARIINISYGSIGYSQAEYDAIKRARDAGAIVATSAGNDGVNNQLYPHYPSNYLLDNIVAVAATDRKDNLTDFSNFGVGLVELAAPGASILTTDRASDTSYTTMDGTSFSAPMVSGALALLKAQFPTDTYRASINRLLRSVDPLPILAGKTQTGGRLNVGRALAANSDRPFNDEFASRAAITGANVSLRAHNYHASSETNEPSHAGLTPSGTIWWSWTAPSSGNAVVETTGSTFDTVLAVYTGTSVGALTPIASNDNFSDGVTSRASFTTVAGTTYQIAVGGKNDASGAILLSVGFIPPNDLFADAIALSGPSMRVSGFNSVAGAETGEPKGSSAARGRSVWYKWTAPASTYFSLSVFAYGFDAIATVYTGANVGTLTSVDIASTKAINETASFSAQTATTYYIQVDSVDGGTGPFDLTIIDGIAFPALSANNGTPTVNPVTNDMIAVDSFGFVFFVNLSTADFKFDELSGYVDVQSPAIGSDGSIYIGDDYGYLYAFNPDRSRRWRKDLGYVRVTSSPAIGADDTIYFHTDDGYLHARFTDGTLKWKASVPGESYSSPAIGTDGTIFIGSDDHNLYAISPLDGAIKWKFDSGGEIYSSPAIDGSGALYFGTLSEKLYSVSSEGALRWSYTAGGKISSSPAIGADGTVYFGCYDQNLYALTPTGTLRWKYPTGDEIRASSPAIATDGAIYIGSYDGFIHAVTSAGTKKRVYATGSYVRSSPVIYKGSLLVGSGDARTYFTNADGNLANTPWPMHRQNIGLTGRRASNTSPTVVSQSTSRSVANGGATTIAVNANGAGPLSFQWRLNGVPVSGATQSSLTIGNLAPSQAGAYTVSVTNSRGGVTSNSIVVGLNSTTKLVGPGTEVGTDIPHPVTHFTYDQILLQGAAASIRADPGQIMRVSYVDLTDDIVQVEFSGAGTFSLVLDGSSPPAPPVKYNQSATSYMRGHMNIVVSGADETTNLSVFSVGRGNAVNQALFRDDVTYDGVADIGFIAISSTNGKFGGLRTANANYVGSQGLVGVYAPGVNFDGPVFIGDIVASDTATPVIQLGSGSDVRITGGDLLQLNNQPIQVSGIAQLKFTPGSTSHNTTFPAQTNRGRLEQNGADITSQIVVYPAQ